MGFDHFHQTQNTRLCLPITGFSLFKFPFMINMLIGTYQGSSAQLAHSAHAFFRSVWSAGMPWAQSEGI